MRTGAFITRGLATYYSPVVEPHTLLVTAVGPGLCAAHLLIRRRNFTYNLLSGLLLFILMSVAVLVTVFVSMIVSVASLSMCISFLLAGRLSDAASSLLVSAFFVRVFHFLTLCA
jgi:hypothetical protein